MKHTLTIIIIAVMTMILPGAEVLAQTAYKFAQPKNNVAKEIWNLLKADEGTCIYHILAEAEKIDKDRFDNAEHFKSNTSMEFDFSIPHSYESVCDSVEVKCQLQCYQMKDGSWLAFFYQYSYNVYSLNFCEGVDIYAVQYKNGKLIFHNTDKFFQPKEYMRAMDYFSSTYMRPNIELSDTEINMTSEMLWPIKFVWNGKTFESSSDLVVKAMRSFGDFICYEGFDLSLKNPITIPAIGSQWGGNTDGIYRGFEGKKVAKFDVQNGIVEGYTLLDPMYGIEQEVSSTFHISSAPVAIGYPIKNFKAMNDEYPVNREMKDGKYVVTQQLDHDTKYKRRDIFLELTAQDENSPIQTIRVYSNPLVVTLQGEIDNDIYMTEDAKTIFKALNFNEQDYGEFKSVECYENGAIIDFYTAKDKQADVYGNDRIAVGYFIYGSDGKYLVVLSQFEDEDFSNIGEHSKIVNKFWMYENGKLTPADIKIPASQFTDKDYSLQCQFDRRGFHYLHMDREPKIETFIWDGEKFAPED